MIAKEYDTVVRLVDTTTGKYLHPDPGPTQSVNTLVFSPDGIHLAALDRQRGYVWNLATRELVRCWDTPDFERMAFHPNGKVLAFSGAKGVVLETSEGRRLHTLDGPKQSLHLLAFSPDGKLLAAGGHSSNLWVWDTQTGKPVHVLEQKHNSTAITFSLDGRFLYTSAEKRLSAWDLSTGKKQWTDGDEVIAQVLLARPDGKRVAVLVFDAWYQQFDATTGECTK